MNEEGNVGIVRENRGLSRWKIQKHP